MSNHGQEENLGSEEQVDIPGRIDGGSSCSSSSSEGSPPSEEVRKGSSSASCSHGVQLHESLAENNDENDVPVHIGTQESAPTTAGNKGRLHYLIPPLISAGSYVSSSLSAVPGSMEGRNSTRRSMSASVLGSFKPSSDVSQTPTSRRSFLLDPDEDGNIMQRLATAGIRGSTASEITTELQLAQQKRDSEGRGLSACWFRIRRSRLQLWLFLEEPFLTLRASVLSCAMVTIIFAAVACSVYRYGGTAVDEDKEPRNIIEQLDFVFNLIFVFDFVVRAWAFPVPWRFLRCPTNAVDVVSVLPFLVNGVLSLPTRIPGLSFLSWLSAFEAFLRLLKLSRYFWGWELLFHAVSDSFKALAIPVFFLLLIAMSGSCLLYVFEAIELDHQGDETDCSHSFGKNGGFACSGMVTIRTLPDAVHFCIISILGISTGPFYGMQAQSVAGRATVCVLMAFGMTFMAMPIAIVGSCFSQTWFDQDRIFLLDMVRSRLLAQGFTPQDIRDVFDEVDQNRSGEIDLNEFHTMIRTFNLRSLNATKCRQLFHYFDNDGDGVINFEDFALTLYPDLPVGELYEEEVNGQSSTSQEEDEVPRQPGSLSSRLTWSRLKKAAPSKNYMESVVPWASSRPSHGSSKASLRSNGSSFRAGPRGSQPQSSMGNGSTPGVTQETPAAAAASSSNAPYNCEARGSCVSQPAHVPSSSSGAPAMMVPTIEVETSGDETGRFYGTRLSQPSICSSWCPTSSGQLARNLPGGEERDIDMLLCRIDTLEHRVDRRFERLANLFLRHGVGRVPATAFLTGFGPQADSATRRRHSDCRLRPASTRPSPRPSYSQPQHPGSPSGPPAASSASASSSKAGNMLLLPTTGTS